MEAAVWRPLAFMGSSQGDQPQDCCLLSGGADSLLREPPPDLQLPVGASSAAGGLRLLFRSGVSDSSGEETGLFCLI